MTLSDGSMYQVYRSHYKWDVGFTVRDWRAIVRIANIDTSLLAAQANEADIADLMIKALHRQKGAKLGRNAFYCNETIITYLDLQTFHRTNLHLTYGPDEMHQGKVRQCRSDGRSPQKVARAGHR